MYFSTVYFDCEINNLSFFQEFFSVLYIQTFEGKIKHDFASIEFDSGEQYNSVVYLWNFKYKLAEYTFQDMCSYKNIKFTKYKENIFKFVELKLNQRSNYGFQNMEDCHFKDKDYFFLYFVLPECWSLAQKRIDDAIENGNIYYLPSKRKIVNLKTIVSIDNYIVWLLMKCLPHCKYMQIVRATVHRRFERCVNYYTNDKLRLTTALQQQLCEFPVQESRTNDKLCYLSIWLAFK